MDISEFIWTLSKKNGVCMSHFVIQIPDILAIYCSEELRKLGRYTRMEPWHLEKKKAVRHTEKIGTCIIICELFQHHFLTYCFKIIRYGRSMLHSFDPKCRKYCEYKNTRHALRLKVFMSCWKRNWHRDIRKFLILHHYIGDISPRSFH